jgi:hypothetical protein
MVTYPPRAITSKVGINYVRTIVEGAGSLFHKIEHENDLGIDAIVEIVRTGNPLGIQVGVQIKSGDSYYEAPSESCSIPIDSHRRYWERYPLPVVGIVYVPELARGHWADLKAALRHTPDATSVRFVASRANILDAESFEWLFVPRLLQESPIVEFDEAMVLARSVKLDEANLGLSALFDRYPNETGAWDILIDYFAREPKNRIPRKLIYWMAHIPGHGDIAYSGPGFTELTRQHARARLQHFKRGEVLKLLGFVDRDNGIARGSLGQSVEALISSLPGADDYLTSIATDLSQDIFVRETAALILAMHASMNARAILSTLAGEGSWFARELEVVVREFGIVNPY